MLLKRLGELTTFSVYSVSPCALNYFLKLAPMPATRKKVLYFYSFLSPFVKKDIEILSSAFEVKDFDFYKMQKYSIVLSFIAQKLFLLKNIWTCNLVVCQFSSYLSLLPALYARILNKPCIIISGGVDTVSF